MSMLGSAEAVLEFWFGARPDDLATLASRARSWFNPTHAFDEQIRQSFNVTLQAAAAGELRRWKLTPRGTLALIIIFDQFPRNIYRGTPPAFAYDSRALALSRDAIAMGSDRDLDLVERWFMYLPLEHAEDIEAQNKSVECFERLYADAPAQLREHLAIPRQHALEHRNLIATFGRFPHRNLALDRTSSTDENAWLAAQREIYSQG